MKLVTRILSGSFAFAIAFTFAGSSASAQCGGQARGAAKKIGFSLGASALSGSFKLASWPEKNDDRWGDDRDEKGLEPIVGLWKISFVDKDKGYVDTGYAAWHSDYTEFQNSERTPSTGAVCQGVWEKVGRRTYRLNHFALAYMDSQKLSNVIRIREEVTVDESRREFRGRFITDVYDTSHNLLVEYAGPIKGKRVTIDSDIDSQ